MIWQDQPLITPPRAAFLARILEEVPLACGNSALADHPRLTEAAHGVAAYLESQDSPPTAIERRTVFALLSTALDAAGERFLARRLRMFDAALVYPTNWVVTGDGRVWVMNLRHIVTVREKCIELALFDRIGIALRTFADVWDVTSGKGVLALRNYVWAAECVFGKDRGSRYARDFAKEIPPFCAEYLDRLRTVRQWRVSPQVMCLHS